MFKKEGKQLSKEGNYTAAIEVAYRDHVIEHVPRSNQASVLLQVLQGRLYGLSCCMGIIGPAPLLWLYSVNFYSLNTKMNTLAHKLQVYFFLGDYHAMDFSTPPESSRFASQIAELHQKGTSPIGVFGFPTPTVCSITERTVT